MLSLEKNCNNCFCDDFCCIECCRGKPGPRGPAGEKGDAFTYEDFTPEQLENLKGPQGESGADGEDGSDGKSAYEIAVENGFIGTEQEWLESLVGPPGEPFSRVFGMFLGTPLGPFSGNGMFNTTIIPVTAMRNVTTPDAFVLNDNGTVTVNEAGLYLVTSKLQVDDGYTANFFIQVNEAGAGGGHAGGYSIVNGGTATLTTILSLKAGDRISNSISSTTPIYLTPFIDQLRTYSSVITVLKISEPFD